MRIHPHFGLVAREHGWVPAPRYLLRRARVLKLAQDLPPGRLLEVGCGVGALLHDFAALGWSCTALETSAAAIEIARSVRRGDPRIEVLDQPEPAWRECFDLVTAFEVLEHIEDDAGALASWARWLRPGGTMLLSVPAHQRRWGPSDVWAGHFRRYERGQLEARFEEAALELVRLEVYGFPLANWVAPLRNRMYAAKLRAQSSTEAPDLAEGTARSGIERTLESRLFPYQAVPPGSWLLRALLRVQDLFLDREWGEGFLAMARKPFP